MLNKTLIVVAYASCAISIVWAGYLLVKGDFELLFGPIYDNQIGFWIFLILGIGSYWFKVFINIRNQANTGLLDNPENFDGHLAEENLVKGVMLAPLNIVGVRYSDIGFENASSVLSLYKNPSIAAIEIALSLINQKLERTHKSHQALKEIGKRIKTLRKGIIFMRTKGLISKDIYVKYDELLTDLIVKISGFSRPPH